MTERYFYEPSEGHGLKHDPLNAIIAPRPIGWISTISEDGAANLAPYSFFNLFNYIPPIIGFSSKVPKTASRMLVRPANSSGTWPRANSLRR